MRMFSCTGARPEPHAAGPAILLELRIAAEPGQRVHTLALRTQIRIEPRRRRYTPEEAERLTDLFGELPRWGETLNPLQLATVSTMVQGFAGQTTAEVAVPLSYDIDVAATKYLHGLDDGVVPLLLLFSGTIFYAGSGGVQVGLVPWHEEAVFHLPVAVWRAAMDEHFPGAAWLRLRRETLDELRAYRSERTIPTWDDTLHRLLKEAQTGETQTGETQTGETQTGETQTGETQTGETHAATLRAVTPQAGGMQNGESKNGEARP